MTSFSHLEVLHSKRHYWICSNGTATGTAELAAWRRLVVNAEMAMAQTLDAARQVQRRVQKHRVIRGQAEATVTEAGKARVEQLSARIHVFTL